MTLPGQALVSKVADYGLKNQGSNSTWSFSLLQYVQSISQNHQFPIQAVPQLFLECVTDRTPPSGAEVKSVTHTVPYVFGVCTVIVSPHL